MPSILHLCRRLLTSLAASRTVLQLTLDPAGTSEPSEHEWNRSGSQQRRTVGCGMGAEWCRMLRLLSACVAGQAMDDCRGDPGDPCGVGGACKPDGQREEGLRLRVAGGAQVP